MSVPAASVVSELRRTARDIAIVARFDLLDSLRSRRAVVLMLLHVLGSVASALMFVEVLSQIETSLAASLAVPVTDSPGAMSSSLMESDQFRDVVGGLVGDEELASELVRVPALALFYGAVALFVVPLLVALGSADAIASERATGAARFSFFRTDRTSWAVGKLVGQAVLLAVGLAAGALGVWCVGALQLSGFDATGTALWLVRLGARAWTFGLCWLGITLGISQLTRSVHWSRGLTLVALVVLGAGARILDSRWLLRELGQSSPLAVAASTVHGLLPAAQRLELWRPDLADRLPAVAILLAVGAAGFSLGHRRLLRSDA
jgi:ABC-type transport system involved in multi-copper enzyme maturation permease subunit